MKNLIFTIIFLNIFYLNAQNSIKRYSDLKQGIFELKESNQYNYQQHKETVYLYVYESSMQVYYIGKRDLFLSKEFYKSLLGHLIKNDKRDFKVTFENNNYCVYIDVNGKFKKFIVKDSNLIKDKL